MVREAFHLLRVSRDLKGFEAPERKDIAERP
jgi:hypothetical protein